MKPYKCVVVTPAGRKKYLEVLVQYILKEKDFIDEYRIWVNTNDESDVAYCQYLADTYDFITLDFSADNCTNKGNAWAIHSFFPNCIENNTIYIRLDDDIVWLEDNFIQKIYKFRLNNPQYFLVYANILNNAIVDHIRQRLGCFENCGYLKHRIFGYECMDPVGWGNPDAAYFKHEQFLKDITSNNLEAYRFSKWICFFYERVSINCISWFGSAFSEFGGIVGADEEHWLSVHKPRELKQPNCIYGDALCSHFAFFTQRQFLDETAILGQYKNLLKVDNV